MFHSLRITLSVALVAAAISPLHAQPSGGMGLVTRATTLEVDEVVRRIESTAKERGLIVFAKIDHAAGARDAGTTMPAATVLLLGNPKGGTPVMQAAPSIAIDLPLRVLVSQSAQGKAMVTFNDPVYLQARHGVPADLVKNISGLGPLLDAALK
jgi:uncharacterized protein (DUF302 family)